MIIKSIIEKICLKKTKKGEKYRKNWSIKDEKEDIDYMTLMIL